MIKGLHVVRKARRNKPPVFYVYAYRGGPCIHRHEGWSRPTLSPRNIESWLQAANARIAREAPKDTLSDLIAQWRPNSPEWKALTPNTQRTWSSALTAIEEKWGDKPLSVWNDPRMTAKVVAWRDSRANTARTADFGVGVLRALLKFGRLRGRVTLNVAEGIPQIYRGSARAEIIWTDEDISAFEQEAARQGMTHVADGLRLAALTGLRRGDLVTLTWDEVGEMAIEKLAAKVSRGRRRRVVIPRLSALDELLKRLRSQSRAEGVNTVLVNSYGRAWSISGFGGSFNRIRDDAGIVHIDRNSKAEVKKHLHDVRGTFCTNLITAGELTEREVAEIMGWSPERVAGIRRTYVDQGAVNMAIARRLREGL